MIAEGELDRDDEPATGSVAAPARSATPVIGGCEPGPVQNFGLRVSVRVRVRARASARTSGAPTQATAA